MRFLSGNDTLDTIAKSLASEPTEIALAVAFWGEAALDRLKIDKWRADRTRLICNATSGACNPKALKALHERFGPNFKTNPNLHAKVYWTPRKLAITSANASASGLSLEDGELSGNIEAGVVTTSENMINDVRRWYDELFNSLDTTIVDDVVIKKSEILWERRRRDRASLRNVKSIADVLKNRDALKDRQIFVVNYRLNGRSQEGEAQSRNLKKEWNEGIHKAPVVAAGDVRFDRIDDYEETGTSITNCQWKSWVIDLVGRERCFWFVPDRLSVITNPKAHTTTVPIYGTPNIPFGPDQSISISDQDIKELSKRWTKKVGRRSDKWEPLEKFAD